MEIVHTWYSDMKYTHNRKIVMFMVLLSVKILKAVYTEDFRALVMNSALTSL